MTDKKIAIFGGNSGIGLATAKRLLEAGAEVHAYSRTSDNLDSLHGNIFVNSLDLNDMESVVFPDVLDGLVYFPGTINLKPFKRLKKADFIEDYEVNVIGAAQAIQGALSALKKGSPSSVVLFSSVAAQTGMNFHASISAAKAGVEGLGKSIAAEFAPHIRCNIISPSLTDTPLAGNLLSNDAKRQASEDRHPLKRIGKAEDMAQLVEFLLSDGSGFMTGQVIGVDGGMSQTRPL